ncbi:hypothetical protein LWI29_029973 [Acer saccharum]|uniref:60S ribosomal protein L18a-like protein n=1 Tax=Acer saccharum TaxID=4024 RepID=A0AA39RFM7_ACESA|nr:hypothetical protein LWI29_029973 [Acer saccharum]
MVAVRTKNQWEASSAFNQLILTRTICLSFKTLLIITQNKNPFIFSHLICIYSQFYTIFHLPPLLFDIGTFVGGTLAEDFNGPDTSALALMDQSTTTEEKDSLKNGLELVKQVSNKHLDLLRPSRYYSVFKGQATDTADREKGRYTPLIRDPEDFQQGIYDKPLPCFGCGIGWFSFLLGFVFPLMWYYATFLYFGNYYRKDPRERAGLAASAIAAMASSALLLVIVAFRLLWFGF